MADGSLAGTILPMPTSVRQSLPNGLTVLRLVLAAAFFGALNAYRYPDQNAVWANVALLLFVLAAITDALDGYLARKWKAESTFGRIMDPFCDKVLILGAFIYMAGPRFVVADWVRDGSFFTMATGVYPWMVVVVLARELLVTGFRGEAESMGVSFASSWSGKAKMILQSIAIPAVLLVVVNFGTHGQDTVSLAGRWFCHGVIYVTVIVTIWSGLPYIWRLRAIVGPGASR